MSLNKLVSLFFVGLLAFTALTRWQNVSEEPLIMTDGQGYYAYLPAILIYHDLQFGFVDEVNERYYGEGKRAKFINETPTGNVNKYFAGTAVLESPFFALAAAMSVVLDVPVDGYSWPFQVGIGLAALVYLSFGVYFLGNFLIAIGFKERAVQLTLLLLVFATNLLYYTVYEPSMSHAYSFFTIALFLFSIEKAFDKVESRWFYLAAIAFGLTVLIRPTNGVIVLALPVITGGLSGTVELTKKLFGDAKTLVGSGFIVLAIAGVQPLVYMIQTGSPVVWSYEGEGFNFFSPEFYNVLFSYRKGLFVYCPVLMLSMLGIAVGFIRNSARYAWLIVFLFITTWIISSWWMWYYGGSFGHRAFIEYYPFFAIGLAALANEELGQLKKWALTAAGALLVFIQLVQTYQYNKHIITFDNMTKTKYWNLFLRTGDDLAWYYSGYEGQDSYVGVDSLVVKHNFESERGWGNETQIMDNPTGQGMVAKMSENEGYGPTFRIPVSEIGVALNNVRISAMANSNTRSSDVSFVCSIEDSTGASYFWHKKPLRPQFNGTGNWSWVTGLFRCGPPRDSTDKFVIYPMKSDGSIVYFDDLEVSFIQAQ